MWRHHATSAVRLVSADPRPEAMSHAGTLPPQTFGYIGQGQVPTPRGEFEPFPRTRERLLVARERALFHAYRHTRRGCVCCAPEPEPCACGGMIAPESVADIEATVAEHNGSLLHRQWRENRTAVLYNVAVGRSDANSDNMRGGHRRASTSSVATSCLEVEAP